MASSEAAHEFGALNTLLLVVILGLCILSAYLIKRNSFYYLPESAAAIVVGLIVGCLARAVYPSTEELDFLSFEPEVFFFLLLPPIIFEAAYSLEKKAFFANFWTISLFAVFGTIISTFVIGYLIYMVGLLGIVDINTSSPMEALIFGALISAVDPVATLSIMGNPELNCEPLLYSLVFGESVLNDAVAIVLFKTFINFYESDEEFSMKTVVAIMVNFTGVTLGSIVVGVFTGLVCSYLCKHTYMYLFPEYEISIIFLFAYGSYSLSEALQMSGIMSLFFCGLILSHYNIYNLSSTSQITSHNIFKSMAVLSEYFVFLYIGMGLFTGRFKQINFTFFFLCTLFCLIARIFNIFPLSFLANFGRKTSIPIKMQWVMWFAGLRGAIAFALSQNLPGEHKELYVSTTLGIVIFTTVVCGGLTEPMMKSMGMRRQQQQQPSPSSHEILSSTPPPPPHQQHYDRNKIYNNNSNANNISNFDSRQQDIPVKDTTATNNNKNGDCENGSCSMEGSTVSNNSERGVGGKQQHIRNINSTSSSSSGINSNGIIELLSGSSANRAHYEYLSPLDEEEERTFDFAAEAGSSASHSRIFSGNSTNYKNNNRISTITNANTTTTAAYIKSNNAVQSLMERFDADYMVPLFGGPEKEEKMKEYASDENSEMHKAVSQLLRITSSSSLSNSVSGKSSPSLSVHPTSASPAGSSSCIGTSTIMSQRRHLSNELFVNTSVPTAPSAALSPSN